MSETRSQPSNRTDLFGASEVGRLLYHVSVASNLPTIVDDGLRVSESTHRDGLETELADVALTFGIEFPVVRQDCVFLYPRVQDAFVGLEPDSEYKTQGFSHEGVVVVDSDRIESDLYLGDFNLMSDAIDFQYLRRPDDAMVSSSRVDALRRYAESFREVNSAAEIEEHIGSYHTPEIVVEGGVDSDAVSECVFWKRLHTQGLPLPIPE